jgi:hypothetical protein
MTHGGFIGKALGRAVPRPGLQWRDPAGVLILARIPRTQRYELTGEGRRLAVFFTKTYTRIVNPSLAELDPTLPNEIGARSPLASSWRAFEHAIKDKIRQAAIAAYKMTCS